jgi:sugar phosphate permease
MPRAEGHASANSPDAPPASLILRQRSMWGTCLGLFSGNYFNYFMLTWLPSYLVGERHYSMDRMAVTGGVCYFAVALTAMTCGWLSDRQIVTGGRSPASRRWILIAGLTLSSVFLILAGTAGPRTFVPALIIASMGFGMFNSCHWAVTQTLAGPLAAGRWTGIENFVGNLAGIVAPAVTGIVLDWTGEYFWAFVITSVMTMTGAVAWLFVVGDVCEVDWRAASTRRRGAMAH